jgi:ribosomal-protein-alanine N-acetyltransferase
MPSLVEPFATLPMSRPKNDQPSICRPGVSIVLRPWVPTDATRLKAAFRDKQIQQWCLHRLDTIPEGREWIDRWNKRWRKRTGASWAIVEEKHPDIALGQIGFRSLFLADGLAEISYWIMPKFRRRHLCTDATRMLAEWAFETLGLERLEIVHSTRNDASCPVALRAGFQIEGVKRHLQIHADGFHDMCLHSRISSDSGQPIVLPAPVTPVDEGADAARWLRVLRTARWALSGIRA